MQMLAVNCRCLQKGPLSPLLLGFGAGARMSPVGKNLAMHPARHIRAGGIMGQWVALKGVFQASTSVDNRWQALIDVSKHGTVMANHCYSPIKQASGLQSPPTALSHTLLKNNRSSRRQDVLL